MQVADDIFKGAILALVLLGFWSLTWTDYSMVYHLVRGESTLKLYVIYNVLEVTLTPPSPKPSCAPPATPLLSCPGPPSLQDYFCRRCLCSLSPPPPLSLTLPSLLSPLSALFCLPQVFDKLFCAFGQDVLDAVLFVFLYTDLHWVWCGLSFLAAALYVFGHAFIIFLQLITLNVALNSENNALFTLLVSNNFVELKGNVFKRFGMIPKPGKSAIGPFSPNTKIEQLALEQQL